MPDCAIKYQWQEPWPVSAASNSGTQSDVSEMSSNKAAASFVRVRRWVCRNGEVLEKENSITRCGHKKEKPHSAQPPAPAQRARAEAAERPQSRLLVQEPPVPKPKSSGQRSPAAPLWGLVKRSIAAISRLCSCFVLASPGNRRRAILWHMRLNRFWWFFFFVFFFVFSACPPFPACGSYGAAHRTADACPSSVWPAKRLAGPVERRRGSAW